MKINLIGAIGGGNFGDELILNTCKEQYNAINKVQYIYSGFDRNIILKDKNTNLNNIDINFFNIMSDLRNIFYKKQEIHLADILANFKKYPKIDVIHLIGGGYINNLWPSNYALTAIAFLYSQEYQVPIFATGLGLLPKCNDFVFFKLLNNFDIFDVRDIYSHQLVSASSYSGDDVLLQLNKVITYDTAPSLILSLQSHLFSNQEILKKIFSTLILTKIKKSGISNIIIIEAAPEDVVSFSRSYITKAKNLSINIVFLNAEHLIRSGMPYHINSKVISSRYHLHLIYSMLNIKGIALYENSYYHNKHLSVIGMGSNWPLMEKDQFLKEKHIQNLFDEQQPSDIEKLKKLSDQKKSVFQNILKNIKQNKKTNKKDAHIKQALNIINTYIGT